MKFTKVTHLTEEESMYKKSLLSGLCKSAIAVYLGSLPLLAFSQEQKTNEKQNTTAQEFNTFQELKEVYDSKVNAALEDDLLTIQESAGLGSFLEENIGKVKTHEEKIPGLGLIVKKYPGLVDDEAGLVYHSSELLSEEDNSNIQKLLSYTDDKELDKFKNKKRLNLYDLVIIYRNIKNKPSIRTIEEKLLSHSTLYQEFVALASTLEEKDKEFKRYTHVGVKKIMDELKPLMEKYSQKRENLESVLQKEHTRSIIHVHSFEESFPELEKIYKREDNILFFILYVSLPFVIHLMAKAYKRDLDIGPGVLVGNIGFNGLVGAFFLDGLHPSIFWIRNSLPVLYEATNRKKNDKKTN
ncbi:hypothetical protein HY837_01600 [archaeon]|nr:hypothetical protein [archaeon]